MSMDGVIVRFLTFSFFVQVVSILSYFDVKSDKILQESPSEVIDERKSEILYEKKSFLHNISSKIRAQTTETCQDCQLKKLISAFCLYLESIYNTWYQAEFSSVFYVFVFFDIPMQKRYYIIEQQFQNQNLSFGNQVEGFFCLKRYVLI